MSNEKILVDALAECMVQIQYLHEKFGETGSGNAVLAKGKQAISDYSLAQQQNTVAGDEELANSHWDLISSLRRIINNNPHIGNDVDKNRLENAIEIMKKSRN